MEFEAPPHRTPPPSMTDLHGAGSQRRARAGATFRGCTAAARARPPSARPLPRLGACSCFCRRWPRGCRCWPTRSSRSSPAAWGLNVRFVGVDRDGLAYDFRNLLADRTLRLLVELLDAGALRRTPACWTRCSRRWPGDASPSSSAAIAAGRRHLDVDTGSSPGCGHAVRPRHPLPGLPRECCAAPCATRSSTSTSTAGRCARSNNSEARGRASGSRSRRVLPGPRERRAPAAHRRGSPPRLLQLAAARWRRHAPGARARR